MSRPLRADSDRAKARSLRLRATRDAVRTRANYRCEWPRCQASGTDLAHAFGRGHIVAADLADTPAMTWWACRHHHDLYDGRRACQSLEDMADLHRFRWELAESAARFHGVSVDPRATAIDVAREIERRWRETQA
jgi:hypothetical protein